MSEVNLLATNLKRNWHGFVVVMFVLWGLVLLCTLAFVDRTIRSYQASNMHHHASRKQANTMQVVLAVNGLVAILRIIFFVDPRGWEGLYGRVTFELLLRFVMCLMLGQWLLVILRWWELGEFAKASGFRKLVEGTQSTWRLVIGAIGVLTCLISVLTIISQEMNSDSGTNAVNVILLIYTLVFVFVGLVAGVRASRTLYAMAIRRRQLLHEPRMPRMNTNDLTAASVMANHGSFHQTNLSVHERKTFQIFICMCTATPCAFAIVIVSVWRGASSPTPGEYLAYLVIRHTMEVILSGLLFYAIQRDPQLVVADSVAMRVSMVVTRGVSRQVQRAETLDKGRLTVPSTPPSMHTSNTTSTGNTSSAANTTSTGNSSSVVMTSHAHHRNTASFSWIANHAFFAEDVNALTRDKGGTTTAEPAD